MGFDGKIAIGIPHSGNMLEGYFFDTFIALSKAANTVVFRVPSKPVDLARNIIAESVLADPSITHLYFMDADMRFPADALFRLIQDDKDVIGGTYFARVVPPIPHVYRFHHEDNPDGTCPVEHEHAGDDRGRWYNPLVKEFVAYWKRHPDFAEFEPPVCFPATPDRLVRADALGTGTMLIKRKVLEAMEWPYFKCHERSAGGEDFYFCEQAIKRGFEVWADWSVQAAHDVRGVWHTSQDFTDIFHIGKPDEEQFEQNFLVDMYPQDKARSDGESA